jgi:hypothetical protein
VSSKICHALFEKQVPLFIRRHHALLVPVTHDYSVFRSSYKIFEIIHQIKRLFPEEPTKWPMSMMKSYFFPNNFRPTNVSEFTATVYKFSE